MAQEDVGSKAGIMVSFDIGPVNVMRRPEICFVAASSSRCVRHLWRAGT